MKILVTGGYGFIGSNFIRYMLNKHPDVEIVNLDALTYAGNIENLKDIENEARYRFVHGRVEDAERLEEALEGVEAVVHFAAESHVDRSILDAAPFIKTNVMGTQVLLNSALKHGIKKFVHISTDEVYGALGEEGLFKETDPFRPRSPYSASKAAADLLVQSYFTTYGLPVCIARPSNNYGPYQFPEKLIPLMITNLIEGKKVPVYGQGLNVRDWLFVEDNCRAIDLILERGKPGEAYNIGGKCEKHNIEVVREVLKIMGQSEEMVEFVPDRPGHDFRYALDNTKIESELGWNPATSFEEGIRRTVEWYMNNSHWWKPLKERLQKESKGFWSK
ncbi:MAG: dTDP-glucose 4,6-dehydratase [Caldiserica bacterium]|jgi:dTDP-glucose 4,6-dehydratase|nr:dTDP-glucose 4,6-dehydratase [Caldisericota bacterium]